MTPVRATDQSKQANHNLQWAGTWGASPTSPIGFKLNNQTIRQLVRISIGGTQVQVRFTNETGTNPVVIGAAHVALAGPKGAIKPSTDHILTFRGETSITIPPGAPALSDPVELNVNALETLAISIFIPNQIDYPVTHPLGQQTAYISSSGNHTGDEQIPNATTATSRFYLSGVDVCSPGIFPARTIVAFGDSIIDGNGSTVDQNKRWPDWFADRLNKYNKKGMHLGVVNEGIAGNRILHDWFSPNALSRFDRDVLAIPGVSYVIVLEGINDMGLPSLHPSPYPAATAEQIIGGLHQLINRAHAHHLKISGATLTPFEGATEDEPRRQVEVKRQAVNQWIRTSGEFDAAIDFDAAIRDPDHPKRLRAEFDSGDHFHPNDAGYKAMADSIDLGLFKGGSL